MGFRLELRLRAGEFRLEFDFAALQPVIRRMQRFLELVGLFVPLRNLAVSGLKKFACFVELNGMRLISRPFAFCNFLFRLFQVLLDLLDGPLAFLDRLQSVLRLQGSFRSGSSSLRRLGFALPDPSLAAR